MPAGRLALDIDLTAGLSAKLPRVDDKLRDPWVRQVGFEPKLFSRS
jgi:hypothetical protein